ncbi:MAG: ABC transporter permease [Candidatus Eisenbacteria bacterium]
MDTLIQDLRFAVRSLGRAKGFTAVVVAVMALGIGANVSMFSMIYAIMFRPWPLPEPERLMRVSQVDLRQHDDGQQISWPNFVDLRDRQKSFSSIGGYWDHQAIVTIDRDPERYHGASITSGVLPTIGVMPVLGRNFRPDEEVWGRNWTQVIISDRIWKTRYGGRADVLGRTIRLNGRTREIVGVLPPNVRFPELEDFWIPAGFQANEQSRTDNVLTVVARLKPGVTAKDANAEMNALWKPMIASIPDFKNTALKVEDIREQWARGPRPFMIVMLLAVISVLLIACANVANLLLARAASRRREIALRVALGASRGRVVRQLLTESVLLALLGGVGGVALGVWGNTIWPRGIPMEMPWFLRFDIDGPVLAYTAAIAVAAGIVFGLAPALHASEGNLVEGLREGAAQAGTSRAGARLRNGLIVAEVAFSIVLLVAAGLMIRTFLHLDRAGRDLRTEGLVAGRILLPIALYPDEPSRVRFFTELERRLEAEPGIVAAGLLNSLPLGRDSWSSTIKTPEMREGDAGPVCSMWSPTPGTLKLLGVAIKRGRDFTPADDSTSARVALVSENAAKRLFPGRDPIGQRLRPAGTPDSLGWSTVVGVTGDLIQGVETDAQPVGSVWAPYAQTPGQLVWFVAEGRGDGGLAAGALRRAVRALDPDIAVYEVRTMKEQFRFALWVRRLFASMIGVFGALALIIAAVGLYGVMAYSVAQRTREIGIRMALGAEATGVLRMVLVQALKLTLLGTGIGIGVALVVTRFMASTIQGVSPTDPPTYTVVTLALVLSGVLAAWVPAWRATRIDPMLALRSD